MVKTRNISISSLSLSAVEAFAALPVAAREQIAKLCHGRQYGRDEYIIRQRDNGHGVYFVLCGRVKVTFFGAQGRQVSFRDMGPGEMLGELSVLDGERRSAEVIALEPTVVASLSDACFISILDEYPSVSNYVLRRLAKLVRLLTDRVVELSTLGVINRIHAELLRLARATDAGANCVTIERMPTHVEFAARVSTHREAVSYEFSALQKSGVIKKEKGRRLTILDVQRLQKMVTDVYGDGAL